MKADIVAGYSHSVEVLTELDLVEYAIPDFANTLAAAGKQVTFGQRTQLASEQNLHEQALKGRRVAIVSDATLRAEAMDIQGCNELDELVASGRWAEVAVPIDRKGSYVNVSILYGVPGANAGGDAYRINERFMSMATARVMSSQDAPHLLLMDGNVAQKEYTSKRCRRRQFD